MFPSRDKKDKEFWMSMYTLATAGMNIVAGTFIGLFMGLAIDKNLFNGRTAPWFTLIFLFLGIIAGFRNMFRMVRRESRKDRDEHDGQGPPEGGGE